MFIANSGLGYLCVCLLALTGGRGLLRLLRAEFPEVGTFFAAPVAMLAFWALALNIGVMAGFGVRAQCFILYPASLALALYGAGPLAREFRDFTEFRGRGWLLALLALALPVAAMLPWFTQGLASFAGSPYPDRWYYLAYGKFLWSWPDSLALAQFAPIYDYAANQQLYRFTSGALMAFFSPLCGVPGDPFSASGALSAFALFAFALSGTFFVRAAGIVRGLAASAACMLLTAGSGWPMNAVLCNNYDNVIALPFFAALPGLFMAADFSGKGQALAAGLLFAAPAVFYPESLSPFVACAGATVFFRVFWPEPGRVRVRPGRAALFCLLALCVAALLAAPSARILAYRVGSQLSQGLTTGVVRPGEGFFRGLVTLERFWAAAFGLVLPFTPNAGDVAAVWLGRVWAAFLALGVVALVKERRFAVLCLLAVFLGGAAIMLWHYRYDYGAYKMLLLGWWAQVACLCAGWRLLAGAGRGLRFRAASAAFGAATLMTLCCVIVLAARFGESIYPGKIADYAVISQIKDHAGGQPVGIFLRNIGDIPFAAYFLDDVPAVPFGRPHEYFSLKTLHSTLDPELAAKVRSVLTDDPDFGKKHPGASQLWESGPFHLFAVKAPPAVLTAFTSPGGADLVDNREIFYLGAQPAPLTVFAPRDASALLRLTAFAQPGAHATVLVLRDQNGAESRFPLDRDGPATFPLSLRQGANAFTLRAESEGPAPNAPLPNGAAGPVRAGVASPEVLPAPQG